MRVGTGRPHKQSRGHLLRRFLQLGIWVRATCMMPCVQIPAHLPPPAMLPTMASLRPPGVALGHAAVAVQAAWKAAGRARGTASAGRYCSTTERGTNHMGIKALRSSPTSSSSCTHPERAQQTARA